MQVNSRAGDNLMTALEIQSLFLSRIFILLALLSPGVAFAQTLITFEEVPPATVLTHQYGAKGVHFQGATTYTSSVAHSGHNALYSVAPNIEAFTWPGPLVITFDSNQRSVQLYAGTDFTQPVVATLTAFNAAGVAIAHDGPRTLPAQQINSLMKVSVAQPAIRRVELLYANDGNEIMDDLQFEGLGVVNPPKTPPKVVISSPLPAQKTNAATFTVRGKVTGPSLEPKASVRVHIPRPPGSTTTADYTYPITLVKTAIPNTRTFSQVVSLGVGTQAITVDAENTVGLHGTANVLIDSLPDALRARVAAEGNLGAFVFGSVTRSPECTYAVYANGAAAATNATTSVARTVVFQKWLALQDQGRFPQLGCSLSDARVVPTNGTAQDFASGRIYSSPAGTFFVPPVFTAAIDVLGGEAGVGLPTSDPTSDSRPAFVTWLFQRFVRSGITLPSTLEIRGDSPRLYVERQAGDGSLFDGILRPSNPTIVQAFDCSTTAGPCPVAAPPDEPLFSGATALCHNKEFNWKALVDGVIGDQPDPPEWVPIKGHYVQTPIWGVLFDVHLANGDNPFSHNNHFEPCPTPVLEALVNEKICPSDWDLKIRPLPGFRSMVAQNRDAVQIEFERVDFQHQLVGYGDPTPGDMVFASGRFVVDCGHGGDHLDSFKTEIHPPSVYTAVRSITYNGRPATEADTWANRFFAGGNAPTDAVDFDIYPPPRPSPQAILAASTPGNQTGLVSVTFKSLGPFGPFRVHITATPGTPEIDKYGQMKMRTDDNVFGFDGRLHVYWDCSNGPC
jgi:hypothetical protein